MARSYATLKSGASWSTTSEVLAATADSTNKGESIARAQPGYSESETNRCCDGEHLRLLCCSSRYEQFVVLGAALVPLMFISHQHTSKSEFSGGSLGRVRFRSG